MTGKHSPARQGGGENKREKKQSPFYCGTKDKKPIGKYIFPYRLIGFSFFINHALGLWKYSLAVVSYLPENNIC